MYDSAAIIAAFDAEAGDVAALTDDDTKILWFNQAQPRLGVSNTSRATLSWGAAAVTVNLPSGFIALRQLEYYDDNDACDRWRLLNTRQLEYVNDGRDPTEGALAAGNALMRYDAEWPDVTDIQDSLLTKAQDIACVYYTLHRLWRLIASNRAVYQRYSTLVGANAVSMNDAEAAADRYLQDFQDARDELGAATPAPFYEA